MKKKPASGYLRIPQNTVGHALENRRCAETLKQLGGMVVDAVCDEPVSGTKFPGFRELAGKILHYREFRFNSAGYS
jgi:hypothetical protein